MQAGREQAGKHGGWQGVGRQACRLVGSRQASMQAGREQAGRHAGW
jgi:hypothetical protein